MKNQSPKKAIGQFLRVGQLRRVFNGAVTPCECTSARNIKHVTLFCLCECAQRMLRAATELWLSLPSGVWVQGGSAEKSRSRRLTGERGVMGFRINCSPCSLCTWLAKAQLCQWCLWCRTAHRFAEVPLAGSFPTSSRPSHSQGSCWGLCCLIHMSEGTELMQKELTGFWSRNQGFLYCKL